MRNTKEKYFNFMLELYQLDEFNQMEQSTKYGVSSRIATHLKELGIIRKNSNQKLTWVGEYPTGELADKVLQMISDYNKEAPKNKKGKVNADVSLKYLDALKELKNILGYTKKIGLTDFCLKNGIATKAGKELVAGGILKNLGGKGVSAEYEWDTIEPNLKMATELQRRVNKSQSEYYQEKKKKKETPKEMRAIEFEPHFQELKTSENGRLESTTKRYFFGLIKIKTIYNYE